MPATEKSGTGSSTVVASQMKNVLENTDLRDAIRDRLSTGALRERVVEEWTAWSRREVARRLKPCFEELQRTFTQKPFSQSLVFATFDWPGDGDAMAGWMAVVLAGSPGWEESADVPERYRRKAVVNALLETYPAMKKNPDTESMMVEMILPFRVAIQAQVVAFALDEAMRSIAGAAAGGAQQQQPLAGVEPAPAVAAAAAAAATSDGAQATSSGTSTPATRSLPRRILTGSERHAQLHCTGGDVMVAQLRRLNEKSDTAAIQRLRATAQAQKHVTRFMDYLLIFLETDPDEVSDSAFIDALRPLADEGLAFALHDAGALMLQVGSTGGTEDPSPERTPPGPSPRPATASTSSNELVESLPPVDSTSRQAAVPYVVRWVKRGASRGGATLSPTEIQAVNYLERAMALGHTEARVALGDFHVARAASILRVALLRDEGLLTVTVPAAAAGRRSGPASPAPQGAKLSGSTGSNAGSNAGNAGKDPQPAWPLAVKYHMKAAAKALEDLAEGMCPVWDSDEHEDDMAAAKKLLIELATVKQRAKQLLKPMSGKPDALNPWIREALSQDGWHARAFKAWRIFVVAAGLGAIYMAYLLYTAPPSQCAARR